VTSSAAAPRALSGGLQQIIRVIIIIMPILFQYRNIRHLFGMYITKQAEQERYLIAQTKSPWCAQLFKSGLKKKTGVRVRKKEKKETAR